MTSSEKNGLNIRTDKWKSQMRQDQVSGGVSVPLLASRTHSNVPRNLPKFGNKVKISNKSKIGNKVQYQVCITW